MVDINYLAVIVAALASVVVGFAWYGFLFQKPWMREMGFTMDSMKSMSMTPMRATLMQFVASLVTGVVLTVLIAWGKTYYPEVSALKAGVHTALWVWLGFYAPMTLGAVLWEGKSYKLWFINASNWLVTLLVMGMILSLWY